MKQATYTFYEMSTVQDSFPGVVKHSLARDEMYGIDTGCEIVEFTPGSINSDAQSERPFDEIDVWARRVLAANGFGDY